MEQKREQIDKNACKWFTGMKEHQEKEVSGEKDKAIHVKRTSSCQLVKHIKVHAGAVSSTGMNQDIATTDIMLTR
ncbi:hypothetical protein ACH3XW_43275 [Acanthocheilonema viteae]